MGADKRNLGGAPVLRVYGKDCRAQEVILSAGRWLQRLSKRNSVNYLHEVTDL